MAAKRQTRREFIAAAARGALGFGLGAALSIGSRARAAGANGDIRVAIVGLHSKGKSHIEDFTAHRGARIVALCDVDRNLLDAETKSLQKAGIPVAAYTDFRKLLENPDIDAVVLAVPHHWHVLMTVWACQAGKDVYVEKPATHNIWEGRQLMAAAKRYGRIVQCGMQRRSDSGWAEALAWINAGNLGKVLFSHGLCYKLRESIGKTIGPQPIPDGIDCDLLPKRGLAFFSVPPSISAPGPAFEEKIACPRFAVAAPLRRKNLHYDWHNFWDYGNGDASPFAPNSRNSRPLYPSSILNRPTRNPQPVVPSKSPARPANYFRLMSLYSPLRVAKGL